ncbi:MAG: hypothetical protein IT305_19135 [Chloroflexi bacterium]|nr:hypothetical protein [Chloroflexota bacterium]
MCRTAMPGRLLMRADDEECHTDDTSKGVVPKHAPGRVRFGLGGPRRRLLLLAGLGAAVGAGVVARETPAAKADGRVIGVPLGYAPLDAQSDGV